MEELECEGGCQEHKGEVITFHVVSPGGFDWGYFDYCENAITEDLKRQFIVTKEDRPTTAHLTG